MDLLVFILLLLVIFAIVGGIFWSPWLLIVLALVLVVAVASRGSRL